MAYLLGFDVGSSSIKASLLDAETGKRVAQAVSPQVELEIKALKPGWAEQSPLTWWEHVKRAAAMVREQAPSGMAQVAGIGISYQMHGLVTLDREGRPLRDAIIWCDSRAVPYGEKAFRALGPERCLAELLNSPGNFTAAKLAWVKEHEPDVFERIWKIMLPGDYIAYRFTGRVATTPSGLSEGILWDVKDDGPARFLMEYFGFPEDILPEVVPSFSDQGRVLKEVAEELGIPAGVPVAYRAGDQPNNAFSLAVLNPGEAAATAGTSGVVYGVTDRPAYDTRSRVNTFVHVNHGKTHPRYGVLLCLNGTGILNRWVKQQAVDLDDRTVGYEVLNEWASRVPVGSEGVVILPYGNGAERTLENRDIGGSIHHLNFNIHRREHLLRAAQEGIVFALAYGMEIMEEMGMPTEVVRAGHANMFLSPLFREAFANTTGARIELFDTDGSEGAARGAGVGVGIYSRPEEAYVGLSRKGEVSPEPDLMERYREAYERWKETLRTVLGG
ncbi:xylulokinase [Spirochaeta thermophila]|uniref:Xylulose kinase n=1 Tax=Winmispira thermophila (strain ATCC 49972 / DSM 6192 / RI 19.B1) TaxID=665571 RepID=E0RNB1_WINT6|nr:FGGY family carbohydrate kinase [Spirochaeta thermophila]ADN01111.1 xylulose kinase [Spirochaeta thermophila DSM 6192]